MKSSDRNKRAGAILAFIIGVLYLVYGIAFFLIPTGGAQDYTIVLPAYTATPAPYVVFSIAAALIAVLGLGFARVVSRHVGTKRFFLLRWIASLAMLGFAVEAVDQIRSLGILSRASVLYSSFSETMRESVIASQHLRYIDNTALFRFGFVGVWFIVLNLYALKRGRLALIPSVLGIIGGVLMCLAMAGSFGGIDVLMTVGAGAAVIIGPIWYIWTGMILLPRKK